MPPVEQPDDIVWDRFKNGDREAFETLIRAHYQSLYAYGQRFEKNTDLVKDCIHDLFTHLWQHRASLSPTDAVRPYLLTSLRNRIFKEKQRESYLDIAGPGMSGEVFPTGSVQDEIIRTEEVLLTRRKIEYALKSLTPRQQEVIYLRFFQDLTHEQIAGLMNISKPAVSNLLHLTLKLLREKWVALLLILKITVG